MSLEFGNVTKGNGTHVNISTNATNNCNLKYAHHYNSVNIFELKNQRFFICTPFLNDMEAAYKAYKAKNLHIQPWNFLGKHLVFQLDQGLSIQL